MRLTKATFIAGVLALAAAPALAGNDIYRGDGTTRAGQTLYFPYAAANHCPAGLQPVLAYGQIQCCKPNTTASYYNAPGARKAVRRHSAPRAQAPKAYYSEGVKGAVYR